MTNDFSLFEGDPLNRMFSAIGLRSRGFWPLAGRFLVLIVLTCLPTVMFALLDGFSFAQPRPLNLFGDIAAFGQAFIGYPLFILAEAIISKKTASTGKHFLNCGVIPEESLGRVEDWHKQVAEWRKWWVPDAVCFGLGFLFAMFWLYDETHNAYDTWHAIGAPGTQWPTRAGLWVAFVGIPVFNYWWLRWIWKIGLWCWYLRKVSKLRLRLIASHPDLTGGLGFLTEAQTSFAAVIFAFGIGIVAPLVAYKIDIEGADLFSYPVMGPLAGFILGAPIFFTLPLLLFTKQLGRTKKRAVDLYQDRATEAALIFEERWLKASHSGDCEDLFGNHLQGMKNLNLAYDHIKNMRVVPFDKKSFTQLFSSSFGSLVPLILKLAGTPEPALKLYEQIQKFLGH